MEPEEMEPEPPGEQSATAGVQSAKRVRIAKQGSYCQGAVDVEPLVCHCSTANMV